MNREVRESGLAVVDFRQVEREAHRDNIESPCVFEMVLGNQCVANMVSKKWP